MKIGEVARLFNVCTNTIQNWEKRGYIACVRTLGGHRRYDRSEVDKLLRSRKGEK